jgi:hypothetical protein
MTYTVTIGRIMNLCDRSNFKALFISQTLIVLTFFSVNSMLWILILCRLFGLFSRKCRRTAKFCMIGEIKSDLGVEKAIVNETGDLVDPELDVHTQFR